MVNNAGIGGQSRQYGGVREALRQCLATNVVGAVSVTEAFLPLLLASSRPPSITPRLIFISSTTGSLTYASDPNHVLRGSGGAIDYRTSKAALSMVVIQYDAMLSGRGVRVFGVNPGCESSLFFYAYFSFVCFWETFGLEEWCRRFQTGCCQIKIRFEKEKKAGGEVMDT